jgi:UDP-N-acetylmuramate--L-alanine ligase
MKKRHKRVHYFEEIMDAKDFVERELRPNDLFITVGAGDNWKLGRAVYNDLLARAHV